MNVNRNSSRTTQPNSSQHDGQLQTKLSMSAAGNLNGKHKTVHRLTLEIEPRNTISQVQTTRA